ncbi:putative ABC transporter ATP-binding protein YfmM [Heyndrickxia sporothermodurans]|nr:putative ABC transporter ATP-binding protein YfmM [Heyndrickxia sporothermodurans]
MSILSVKNLSHGFGDRAIFNDVSFRLLKGEHIGLIGANGEGKSTFMNIITGKLQPDEGKVEWAKKVRVGYLDQHAVLKKGMSMRDVLKGAFQYLFDLEAEMNGLYEKMGDATPEELEKMLEDVGTIQDILTNNDFYIIDAKVEEVARGLGLDDVGLERDVQDLSGGQRTKVLLAKLLLEKPDILLLDEPTNYLDEQHIEWLKRYLQDYENAFILISHDIPFLNSVINLIYHMENQELNRYVGDYDSFMKVYEMKKQQLESAYKKQQQEISELKDFVARNKARVSTRNMAMSRQKKLDKMDVIELAQEKPKPEFHFKEGRTSGKLIFETKDLVIGYNEPLSRPLNLKMERGQKIALVGANGIGKTTLLKSILGEISPINGAVQRGDYLEIGYFEQEIKQSNYNTCIEEVWNEFPSFTQYEVRAALAKCGLTTKHIESKVEVLSGGEKAKVRLCKLINRETNILVLDEPTNHLDVDAKDELKRALKAYKGSVLIICHEPEFYQDVITDVWNCENWTTKVF